MAVGEWDQRQLCPDGACIGVIGPDGTCKVCGHAAPNWGDERTRGLLEAEEDGDEEADDDLADGDEGDADDEDGDEGEDEGDGDEGEDEGNKDGDDDELAAAPERAATTSRGGWTARQLCPDGACIGVIGADGRCKVCGRPASDAPEGAATAPAAEAAAPEDGSSAADPDSAPAADPREPCADTSCSGQIGAGGRCEVCGKGAS